VFPVEVRLEDHEDALAAKMAVMRSWLDHRRFRLSTFRHTVTSSGIVFHLNFGAEAEATMFAKEFGGRVIGETPEMSSQEAAD
jgi:hypothetical protein